MLQSRMQKKEPSGCLVTIAGIISLILTPVGIIQLCIYAFMLLIIIDLTRSCNSGPPRTELPKEHNIPTPEEMLQLYQKKK